MMNNTRRSSVAIHEAAHAIASHRAGLVPWMVTIIPDEEAGTAGVSHDLDGPVTYLNEAREECQTEENSRSYLVSLLAGLAANLENGDDPEEAALGAASDTEKAHDFIQVWGPAWTYDDAMGAAREFVRREWRAIQAVADELLEHETLDDEEVELVILTAEGDEEASAGLTMYRALKSDS